MIRSAGSRVIVCSPEPSTRRHFWVQVVAFLVTASAFVVAFTGPAAAAIASPVAGDSYAYLVTNGYSKEAVGKTSYRIDQIGGDRITVSVTPETPALGTARTEVYTGDGNWLRHVVVNHDQPVEYEFAPAYPAYVFPLEPGKSWSMRVNATDPATGRRNSVRVDGTVLGTERIRVPAGEFDTIKIRRLVYAGDWDGFRHETNITEIDWYAPALGRAVRSENKSGYLDMSRCSDPASCDPVLGDWNVFELAEVKTEKP